MAARRRDFVDQKVADLGGQIAQFRLREVLQIGGPTDLFKHFASVRRAARSSTRTSADTALHTHLSRSETTQISLLT